MDFSTLGAGQLGLQSTWQSGTFWFYLGAEGTLTTTRGLAALCLAIGLLVADAPIASADITICNRSGDKIKFAMIYEHYHTFGEPPTWPIKGWFSMNDGQCEVALTGRGAINAFFSVVVERENFEKFIYPFEAVRLEDIGPGEVGGVQLAFCIDDGALSGYKDQWHHYLRGCGPKQIKQFFNVFIRAPGRTNFRWTISPLK